MWYYLHVYFFYTVNAFQLNTNGNDINEKN